MKQALRVLQIVRATPDDAPTLSAIAFAAKAHWGYPPEWMNEWRTAITIQTDYVRDHEAYKAISPLTGEVNIAGFYALEGAGQTLILEHLWVLPDAMGTGVGRTLFAHAVNRAKALGASTLEWESDPNAEGFYLHMGAHRIGERRADMDSKPRILPRMRLEIE